MSSDVEPIGAHEGVELAESTGYYLRRNHDARQLLTRSDIPSIEDSSGRAIMHYETMIIRAITQASHEAGNDRRVHLHPALPINGASPDVEMDPIPVTLMEGTDVRGGFIALLQRMNDSQAVGMVYFFSDDHTPTGGAKN